MDTDKDKTGVTVQTVDGPENHPQGTNVTEIGHTLFVADDQEKTVAIYNDNGWFSAVVH